MKKLIMINGTMGVGKSTVCRELIKALTPSVYLDGDWCWNMNPFMVTDENKTMVMDNITHLLKSFLNNSGYEYIIFCWVIPEESIFQDILKKLSGFEFELYKISLVCSEKALKERLEMDIQNGVRKADVLERSLSYLGLFQNMDTAKMDVSDMTVEEAVRQICQIVEN